MKIGSGKKVRKILNHIIPVLSFLVFQLFITNCSSSSKEEIFLTGSTMGTSYSVKIVEPYDKNISKELKIRIDSVLNDVNNKMSTYLQSSELSRFNRTKSAAWIRISEDLAHVIKTSKVISEESNGSFDITVGPLVNLWGFGPTNIEDKIPDESKIKSLLKDIGIDKVELDLKKLKIRKKNPDIYCDLSAIAKGFGVDKVGLFLEKNNIKNYMVEIGGEVRTKGLNKQNKKWRIGISTPAGNGLEKIVDIANLSIATSGDYYNYYEINGVRYSHTIDPRTGRPITHKLASVSVIHEDCEKADAFATAIDVMGPEEGYKFALKMKLPVFMIVRKEKNFIEKMTPQFEDFIIKD